MERKFEIVTDSGCDLTEDYRKQNGVYLVPLGFTMNNVNYGGEDGEKITEKEFYARLRQGATPTTYQATCEGVKRVIEPILQAGRDVLCVAFSSGLSGTHGSFVVAVRELKEKYPKRKILLVDSLCASMGQGLLVDYILRFADRGERIESAAKYAEGLKLQILHSFTVDNLFHLKRGGRVSSLSAVVGTVLKIKPVMHVNNQGKLIVLNKAMGRKKAIATMLENLFSLSDLGEDDPIFISHGDVPEELEFVKAKVLEKYPKQRIETGYIGAVIGCHSGAGTLAIFCKGKKRE
jgi:DegV family protein with EDD domain